MLGKLLKECCTYLCSTRKGAEMVIKSPLRSQNTFSHNDSEPVRPVTNSAFVNAVSFFVSMTIPYRYLHVYIHCNPQICTWIAFILVATLLPALLLPVECSVVSRYASTILKLFFSAFSMETCSSRSRTQALTDFSEVHWSMYSVSIFIVRILWSVSFSLTSSFEFRIAKIASIIGSGARVFSACKGPHLQHFPRKLLVCYL